jgi:hypothetical protein
MKYTTEMGLGAMTYIPSFTTIGSDILKLIRGIHRHKRQDGHHLSLFSRFSHETSMLKIEYSLHHLMMNLQWKRGTLSWGPKISWAISTVWDISDIHSILETGPICDQM